MTALTNVAIVDARQTALRREGNLARLARIGSETPEPRPNRALATLKSVFGAWTHREDVSFAGGFLGYDGRDQWPRGVQENYDARWRWTR
jgi:hypothetical protein